VTEEEPDATNVELEICVTRFQSIADELAAKGADYGTIAMALVEVIAQIAEEDLITAEVFLEIVSSLLDEKIEDAGQRGLRYELQKNAALRKAARKSAKKKMKKKKRSRKK
jgi:hypothetical protein